MGFRTAPSARSDQLPRDYSAIVRRPALYRLLSDRVARTGVTLISSPAGSGKTVLLKSWLHEVGLDTRAAWITVDRRESDAQHFWRRTAAALQEVLHTDLLAVTPTPNFDGAAVMARLLSALDGLDESLVLIIDDLHELRSSEALEQLEVLVARRPALLTIVLATRHDPHIGLHRLRVEGQLSEIRAADLHFSLEETREMLSGINLPEHCILKLQERTEGWAAALRLALLSLARHPDPEKFVSEFSGSERTVADYLLAEVLERQPETVRQLLLSTSILERVSGELADVLVGKPGSAAILQELEDDNAFVASIDAQRSWFRYHQLFAELLQLELKKRGPTEIRGLHSTAARWFSEHGFPLQAVRHAQAAEDWGLAARVLSDSWFSLYLDGRSRTAYEYLAEFPSDVTATDPELIALMAAKELDRGLLELADHYLGLAVSKADSVPQERRERLHVVLAVLTLSLARQRGDVPTAVEEGHRALEPQRTADAARLGLGDDLRALTLLNLGFVEIEAFSIDEAEQYLEQGLALAQRIQRPFLELTALSRLAATASFRSVALSVARARQAIALAETHGWSGLPVVGLAYWAQAMCLVWQGRLEEAEPLLDLAEQGQQPDVEPAKALAVLHTRAMVDLLRGRNEAAVQKLLAADRLAHRLGPGQALSTMIQRWLLPTLATLGGTTEVEQALAELNARQPDDAQVLITVAWVRIIRGDPAAATVALAPVLDGSAPVASTGVDGLHAFLLEAIARDMMGEAAASMSALERALDLAEPDGMLWAFLLHPVRDLLERHRRGGTVHEAFLSDILDLIDSPSPRAKPQEPEALQEHLSESELRVLRFLPSNLSAPEIAAELSLSTSTVKTHMRHIYAKLDVHGRSQAVSRARELRLLAPVATLRR